MTAETQQKLQEFSGMDLDATLKEMGIPREAYERIVRISLVSTADKLSEIEGALTRHDLEFIQRAGHELKGVFANLRLTPLSEAARQMDVQARAGSGAEVRKYCEEFRQEFVKLNRIFSV